MSNIQYQDQGDIRVADITIAQLSRGLYRSTATAFKELVSNAYDADATVVRIDTNYPEFDFISCVDDGTGMPIEEFLKYFKEEGIGACRKRKHQRDTTGNYGRPIIGRLGIGMLAIGQLCHSFEIESHYRDKDGNGKAYHAKIILSDTTIPDREEVIRNDDTEIKEIDIGKWKYEVIEYEETKKGFRIYSTDVRSTFRREMRLSIGKKERAKMSFRQSELHTRFYDKSKKSVRDCGPYLETIWELATLCPLPYHGSEGKYPIDFGTFPPKKTQSEGFKSARKCIEDQQSRFLGNSFRLVFDGIELRRHIQLPTGKGLIPKLYFVDFDGVVFDSRLKFSGYLFAQIPEAVRPYELNGVQIRLRGVGIGGYDSTFLRYSKKIETIRNRWVSGELFVDLGLEEALNIDRDSFNEHDEHFKKLQECLHTKLDEVFGEIDRIARAQSEGRRDKKDQDLRKSLRAIIAKESEGKLRLRQLDLAEDAPIVVVDGDRGRITLNMASRPIGKKRGDMIARAIMLAYHSAKRLSETEEEQDERFYQLVMKILQELV